MRRRQTVLLLHSSFSHCQGCEIAVPHGFDLYIDLLLLKPLSFMFVRLFQAQAAKLFFRLVLALSPVLK